MKHSYTRSRRRPGRPREHELLMLASTIESEAELLGENVRLEAALAEAKNVLADVRRQLRDVQAELAREQWRSRKAWRWGEPYPSGAVSKEAGDGHRAPAVATTGVGGA